MGCTLRKCWKEIPENHKDNVTIVTNTSKDSFPVLPHSVVVFRATVLIQQWYRKCIARIEAKRRYSWQIFENIEYAGEQNQLKLKQFYNILLESFEPKSNTASFIQSLSKIQDKKFFYETQPEIIDDIWFEAESYIRTIFIGDDYTGAELSFPLKVTHVNPLLSSLIDGQRLHVKYLIMLLVETRKALQVRGNINYVCTAFAKKITICGDLHGSLNDLLTIFQKNGLPSAENPYIFNGDFVDRGENSLEILILLFFFFLRDSNSTFLNRGNHEDHMLNIKYGFVKEIFKKHLNESRLLLKIFQEIFSWLPLATIIDDSVFVIHGGLSLETGIDEIANIPRHKYRSIIKPLSLIYMDEDSELFEWNQIIDILWSDPTLENGCSINLHRGAGKLFGPDVTEKFLKKTGFSLVVRSHQCKQEGYELMHDNKLLTVFSASNYYAAGSNKGAFISLHEDLVYHISQYISFKETFTKRLSFIQRISYLETSAICNLKENFFSHKIMLMEQFKLKDTDHSGKIPMMDWCTIMENVTKLNLPWKTLRSKLVQCDDDQVSYMTTFQDLKIKTQFVKNGKTFSEILYEHRESLENLFRVMDKHNLGKISLEEFEKVIVILIEQLGRKLPMHKNDVKDLSQSLDINKDGFIDVNEFVEAFRIVSSK